MPRLKEIDRVDLPPDELVITTPTGWGVRGLADLANRPFVVEPATTAAGQWAFAACRASGFEPDARYTSTDLGIHLRWVREGLAAALLPQIAGPREVPEVAVHGLGRRPARRIVGAVRRGASERPAASAFCEAVTEVKTPADR